MKKLITALVVAALLLTLAPATIIYAAEGGVTGSGKGGNTAPTVDGVWLVETGDDTAVIAMSPLAEYRVKVTVSDINTIDDIQTIEFHVYHTSNGAQSQTSKWDADECAIFMWDKTGGWTMENTGTTTWVLVSGDSIAPSVFTGTTDDWYLAFRPGELAQADASQNWHAWARADDENKKGEASTATGASMGAYNEISFDTATIVFGTAAGIEPGQTGYITSPYTYVTPQVGTNDTHALGVKSELTWDDMGTNTITLSQTADIPPGTSGQFTLIVDDETLGDPGEPKTKTQGVTISNTTIAGHATDGRTETIDNGDEGTSDTQLWMALSFAMDGINEVTYSGIITFTVTN